MEKLFAVYLGGKARGGTLEVHDVAFAVGETIESTFPQLKESWFGTQESLHVDSYVALEIVDGHQISLRREPSPFKKLFFVNVGSYEKAKFGENHSFYFLVCADAAEAKRRGKALVKEKREDQPHTDNLIELDDVHEVARVRGLHVHAAPSEAREDLRITNLYWPLNRKA